MCVCMVAALLAGVVFGLNAMKDPPDMLLYFFYCKLQNKPYARMHTCCSANSPHTASNCFLRTRAEELPVCVCVCMCVSCVQRSDSWVS